MPIFLELRDEQFRPYEREEHPPSISFVVSLCKELNVNPSWFLLDKGSIFIDEDNDGDIKSLIAQSYKLSQRDLGLLENMLGYLSTND